ncbi:MAG: hypothetical protein M1829_003188 [Trizodia sp. TS-e1964]|nr:MAG: hypothetical protein M1829_003188 [Trizodia sp. TS-e1964]
MATNATRIPYLAPPTGVKSNFDDPENHIVQMHVAGITLLTITLIFVLMRMFTRIYIMRTFGWDDGFCVVSALLVIMVVIASLNLSKLGVGVHLWDLAVGQWDRQGFIAVSTQHPDRNLPAEQVKLMLWQWNNVAYIGFMAAMGFIKISVLLFYNRIFNVGSYFKYCLWATMFFVVGSLIGGELSLFFGCQPISHRFDANYPRVCFNLIAHIDAVSYLDIIADFILVALPVPMLLKLKLGKRDKAALMTIFTTGLFVCAVGIARVIVIDSTRDSADSTYANEGSLWSDIECCVALICCCAPTLKPLMRYMLPNGIGNQSPGRVSSRLPSFLVRYQRARKSDKEKTGDETQLERASEMELGVAGHNTSYISSKGLSSHVKSNASSEDVMSGDPGINKTVSVNVEHASGILMEG